MTPEQESLLKQTTAKAKALQIMGKHMKLERAYADAYAREVEASEHKPMRLRPRYRG